VAGHGGLCQRVSLAQRDARASGSRFAIVALLVLAVLNGQVAVCVAGELDKATNSANPSVLQIRPAADSVFVVPGSPVTFSLSVDSLVAHASQRLQLRSSLISVASGEQIATRRQSVAIDSRGASASMAIEFSMPERLGVYEFRCELSQDDESLWNPFRRKSPPLLRAGRPLIIAPQTSGTTNATERTALLYLPRLRWVDALAGGTSPPPGFNVDAWRDSDQRTRVAARLWSATQQINQYLSANELDGVVLAQNDPQDVGLPERLHQEIREALKSDAIDAVTRMLSAQRIQYSIGPPDASELVPVRKSLANLPPDQQGRRARGEYVLARVLGKSDPLKLVLDYPLSSGPLSDPARALLRGHRTLPAVALETIAPADPASTTAVVRAGVDQGYAYLALLSLAPWASDVHLRFDRSAPGAQVGWQPVDESTTTAQFSVEDTGRLRITLAPGELRLLKSVVPVEEIGLRSWTARLQGGAQQAHRIKEEVTAIVQRIGLLTNLEGADALTNGGFEQQGDLGIVGWMNAQYPPGCVEIDQRERVEGNNSVLLSTDPSLSARTWIVSEPIAPPPSSRLAVSLAIRAARSDDPGPHQMRISLESSRSGQPVRYSSEFQVPRNGQWGARQMVLEVKGIDQSELDSLRLTIDSISAGRVWIDDIRVHHWFATAAEREELQSQAFLAVQGLQQGDLSPSARLLVNPWAQFLSTRPAAAPDKPASKVSPKPPGVAQRIRNWLPEPIRF